MKNTIYVISLRYSPDGNYIGGDDSWLCQVVETLQDDENLDICIMTLKGKSDTEYSTRGNIREMKIAAKGYEKMEIADVYKASDKTIISITYVFEKQCIAYILENAKPGDSCVINTTLYREGVLKLKQGGLRVVQICHVLLSEFVFDRYLADYFAAKKSSWLKERLRKYMGTHKKFVRISKYFAESRFFSWLMSRDSFLEFLTLREYEMLYSCEIVCPTETMKKRIMECYNIPEEQIAAIPWGVKFPETQENLAPEIADLRTRYGINEDRIVISTLSRISPEKGILYLLQALLLLEKTAPDLVRKVDVIICGRPTMISGENYYKELKDCAQKLSLCKVHFPGFVTGKDKSAHLYLSDIYVFPSKYESFGLSILEAMCHENAIISSDTDGAIEVLEDDFGILLPFFENIEKRTELVAEAIEKVAQQDYHGMGKKAGVASRNYSWERTARAVVDVCIK